MTLSFDPVILRGNLKNNIKVESTSFEQRFRESRDSRKLFVN